MSVIGRKTACGECPYRRTSTPGWLGSDEPVPFVAKTYLGEMDMPCHSEIDYEEDSWELVQEPHASMCAGALIMLNKSLKRPRNPKLAAGCDHVARDDRDRIFSGPGEFITHHSGEEVDDSTAYLLMINAALHNA